MKLGPCHKNKIHIAKEKKGKYQTHKHMKNCAYILGKAASYSVMTPTYNLTSSKLHRHKVIKMMSWW